jgi:hypothetical protein
MTINSSGNGDRSKDPNLGDDFDADDSTAEEATRILPKRPTQSTPLKGTLVGVAQSDEEAGDDEEKTVFLPAGVGSEVEKGFDPAVAWLVVIKGPGRGEYCPVFYGQNSIGRGENQRIRLNFGDTRITRDSHAFLIYDDMARKFFLRDNGKANLLRLNEAPVMVPTEVKDRDQISLGETVLLFVALCGQEFDWMSDGDEAG